MSFKTTRVLCVASVVAALVLFGCTRYQVTERAMDFNFAIENASNRMLLLNAARASLRHPMHFSDVTQVITTPKVLSSVAFNLPFGGDAMNLFRADPRMEVSQQDAITMVPLNKREFIRGILQPVTFDTIAQYVGQGWPPEFLFFLFVETVYIDEKRAAFLFHRAWNACSAKREKECNQFLKVTCGVLSLDPDICLKQSANDIARMVSVSPSLANGRIDNDPDTLDEIKDFQWFNAIASALSLLDLEVLQGTGSEHYSTKSRTIKYVRQGSTTKSFEVQRTEEPAASEILRLKTKIPGATLRSRQWSRSRFCDAPTGPHQRSFCISELVSTTNLKKRTELGGTLRSPQGMLFYLGELINAQQRADAPTNRDLANKRFPVVFGRLSNAAVSVSFRGTTYSIPMGKDGENAMQSLALIHQVLGLQKNVDELPTVPTVISTGN